MVMLPDTSYMRQKLAELEKKVVYELWPIAELPYNDWFHGYWDLCFGVYGHVKKYLRVYEKSELNDDQRFALMTLIVASYARLLIEQKRRPDYDSEARRKFEATQWNRIANFLNRDRALFTPIVEHWCNFDDYNLVPKLEYFTFFQFDTERVTSLMRQIWEQWHPEQKESANRPLGGLFSCDA